jgi:CO/xanthine dehydrogenase Mo-binding subunit/aerobic-type carbon monoxide dehydrogenase small subunit (CoxS/CutS family)
VTSVSFEVNGSVVEVEGPPLRRLTEVLRDGLGLTGTKVGCDAGDCGACSVLLDGRVVEACMVPMARVHGRRVVTVEGLASDGNLARLQRSFSHHGAAQCGICTPGMLVAASALLDEIAAPTEEQVKDALGGVLCRCTGYRKIIAAVLAAPGFEDDAMSPPVGKAVGRRVERVDGAPKLLGTDVFGADEVPEGSLVIKVVRSPFHRARFRFGDIPGFVDVHSGVHAVFTADDVPGRNRFGVIPAMADQPVFASGEARFRGEAVAMVVGEPEIMEGFDPVGFPVEWEELPPLLGADASLDPDAPLVHESREGNVLTRGLVQQGDVDSAAADVVVEGEFTTGFIEHAYIEPEAGYAERVGDRIEIQASTQTPHMDRTEIAAILDLEPEAVRIKPTAVGGGFGSKLDLSVQPFLALAAWKLNRAVRITYTRPESMMSTTKRHPSLLSVRIGANADGDLKWMDFQGRFDTGAYASWGPTVANRVPVHAGGPYLYDVYRAQTLAVHTNGPPSGAFRGFGVPQAAVAQECLFDELADAVGLDRLEFRIRNALVAGRPTVTGQVFESGVGFVDCLEALRPHWERSRSECKQLNAAANGRRRGVGLAGMWYGCGNTALPNPSTIKVGLRRDGVIVLFQGAVDIGQGSNTVMTQICADALGVDMDSIVRIGPDTDTTPDAGKTSASRQTFVSGNATFLAGRALRAQLTSLAACSDDARFEVGGGRLVAHDRGEESIVELSGLEADDDGLVAAAVETYDPPTTPLDENGQGDPYAVFGFGAHLVELDVDLEVGTVNLARITAAHDVGRAVNPTLVEGQIEGGIAQGIGLGLMEEYLPGRNENLHDYLIPTFGDVPEVVNILIESNDPLGPYGAKGIAEHTLIPTAPAILNALRDAIGAGIRDLPATPDRVLDAVRRGSG